MRASANHVAGLVLALSVAGHAFAADVDLAQPVPKVASLKPAAFTPSEQIVELTAWKSAVPVGDVVGRFATGLFCSDSKKLIYNKKLDDWFSGLLARTFKDEAVKLGLSPAEAAKSVFEDKTANSPDFRLGATLLQIDYRVCGHGDVKGEAYAKIKWELFSVRRQKVVYAAPVEASYAIDNEVSEKEFDSAFVRVAVDNILGDPKFAEIVRSGGISGEESVAALAPLQVEAGPSVAGGVGKAASQLLESVVTVESGVGSGTAFYISRDGYLLTNQHVVADAKFVRVKLPGGKSVVGEVLRSDKQRDVALLRTDPVTSDVLAVRHEQARIGEDVYALGSPFGDTLSGTLTRGVLSSRRVFEGVPYLQSDVAVNPGNSGGPLIDSDGHVLGIARLRSTAQGINLFIPIDDALEKLGLSLHASPADKAPK